MQLFPFWKQLPLMVKYILQEKRETNLSEPVLLRGLKQDGYNLKCEHLDNLPNIGTFLKKKKK